MVDMIETRSSGVILPNFVSFPSELDGAARLANILVFPALPARGSVLADKIIFNLIQVLVVMAFAPLASGVLARLKEMVQSKRGPSIFQPYRDLWKLFHKDEIVSEESSWIFRFTPYIVFITPIFVALLIPVLTNYPLFFRLHERHDRRRVCAISAGVSHADPGRRGQDSRGQSGRPF